MTDKRPFWERLTLEEMNREQWEALCDGCGLCCLAKLEDDAGAVYYTCVSCRLLDPQTARCMDYENRQKHVPLCQSLTPRTVREWTWLPSSCAYRRLADGRGLAPWHPLISGSPDSVHEAGVGVRRRVIPETLVPDEELENFVADWITAASEDAGGES